MVFYCCVPECNSSSYGENISMHKLPKDENLLKVPLPVLLQTSFCAFLLPLFVIYTSIGLGYVMQWITCKSKLSSDTTESLFQVFSGFLRAAGEEIGWRCYMLPGLVKLYSAPVALLLSGFSWAVFHLAVMILLVTRLKTPNGGYVVLVQSLSCVLSAFPHGWLAMKANYAVWPSAIMHWLWNRVNPALLGSIYTNTPGKYRGLVWKINGEGLAGCIVMVPVALAICADLHFNFA